MLAKILKKISPSRTNRKAGFTIIELMVVIIIVNLLSGVAVPKLTDLIEKTKQKMDLLRLYNLRDSLNRALYEGDIHTIDGKGGSGGCNDLSTDKMDRYLIDSKGMVVFLVEKNGSMPVNYQGTGDGAKQNNMCGLMVAGGFWNTALKEAGFEAVADIITDRANGNKFNANSKTYTWVKANKSAGIEWDRTFPTRPIFVSQYLNNDPSMKGINQSRFTLKIQWTGRNPDSHSLEVFLAEDSKTWQQSLRSRQGVCFSTYGESGCSKSN